eukprot:6970640-Pyramimonas_sp.AAC.1
MWMFYVSFLELGPEVSSQEDAWFCVGALRSKRVSDIDAGVAQAFKMLIKTCFVGRIAHCTQRAFRWSLES